MAGKKQAKKRGGGTRDVVHLPTRRHLGGWYICGGRARGQHRIAASSSSFPPAKKAGKAKPSPPSSSISIPLSNPGPTCKQQREERERRTYIRSQGEPLSFLEEGIFFSSFDKDQGRRTMPSGAMNRLFVESSSSSSSGCREAEPAAAVLCAPRPRRVQVQPCSADLILGPPPFILGNNKSKETGSKGKTSEADEDGGWALFGGSPPARADNPLVHDPHFLLNQRHPAAAPLEVGFFDHQSRSNHSHRPTYISSSHSSSNSFAPSFAPAVRIQGFDVAACRSSHSNGGGRVLSARA